MKRKARKVKDRKPKKETKQKVEYTEQGWWNWKKEKVLFDGIGVA